MNVLVTSASRKVWLIDAFRRALEGKGSVIAADITMWAAAMHRADKSVIVPRSDSPSFVTALLQICATERVSLVIPTRDEELPVMASAIGEFSRIGTRVHVPKPEAVDCCLDKRQFHQFCVDEGFPVPEMIDNPRESDLPLFVRPRRGKGSVGAGRIEHPGQLAAISRSGADLVFNRVIDAPEYTVDVFIGQHGELSAVPRQRIHIVGGESYVARTVDDSALRDAAIELCLAMGLTGHVTVQAFRWADGLAFIEVNPRFGGGAALGFAAGAPSPAWLVQEVRGQRLDPTPGAYRAGLVMLRYTVDEYVEERLLWD